MKFLEMLLNKEKFPINVAVSSAENLIEIAKIISDYNIKNEKEPMLFDNNNLTDGYNKYLSSNKRIIRIYQGRVSKRATFECKLKSDVEESEILCDIYALGEVKSLNEILNPKKENTMANRVKVFEKSEPQVQQIISQMFIFGLTDDRPFVNRLVSAELDTIKQDLNQGILVKPSENCYNIKLLSAYYSLSKLVEKNEEVDLSDAIEYYVYVKEMKRETNPKTKVDYSWIKDYLTQKNINSEDEVVLFESNKLKIFIEDGYIRILTKKTGLEMSVEIRYNNGKFYL